MEIRGNPFFRLSISIKDQYFFRNNVQICAKEFISLPLSGNPLFWFQPDRAICWSI